MGGYERTREILFRGKRIDNGEWIEGYYCPTPLSRFPCRASIYSADTINSYWHGVEVDSKTIGQFIGLIDKNGNKILEGDILKFKNLEQKFLLTSWVGNVEFVYGVFQSQFPLEKNCYFTFNEWNGTVSYEVIGNIYDSPELLEV